ncbi:hydrogenase maturation protease [Haliangium sp.]|uniref:hydrogenase maturation protease n=1 Tax=Haliangium sp. TaxID=2663208 RepID=UPI003D114129
MSAVRIIALGNEAAGDDGAALMAVRRLADLIEAGSGAASAAPAGATERPALTPADIQIIEAGRPGPGLLDLLAPGDAGPDPGPACVLMDVTQSGAAPGTIHRVELAALGDAAIAVRPLSSHGFGPSEALRMAQALGRPVPRGVFVGIEAAQFGPGVGLSAAVEAGLDPFVAAVLAAARALADA